MLLTLLNCIATLSIPASVETELELFDDILAIEALCSNSLVVMQHNISVDKIKSMLYNCILKLTMVNKRYLSGQFNRILQQLLETK